MQKLKLVFLLMLSLTLTAGSCEAQKSDVVANPGKYIEAGTGIYKEVKETDASGSGLETAINVVDTAKEVTNVLNFIPGAQSIVGPVTIGLGILSTVLGLFVAKKAKDIKVEKAKAKVNGDRADDYREAITAGIAHGDDQKTVNVEVMKKVLNTETKTHFNETGDTKL